MLIYVYNKFPLVQFILIVINIRLYYENKHDIYYYIFILNIDHYLTK